MQEVEVLAFTPPSSSALHRVFRSNGERGFSKRWGLGCSIGGAMIFRHPNLRFSEEVEKLSVVRK